MNGQAARETKSHNSEAGRQDQIYEARALGTVKPSLETGTGGEPTKPAFGCTYKKEDPLRGHP